MSNNPTTSPQIPPNITTPPPGPATRRHPRAARSYSIQELVNLNATFHANIAAIQPSYRNQAPHPNRTRPSPFPVNHEAAITRPPTPLSPTPVRRRRPGPRPHTAVIHPQTTAPTSAVARPMTKLEAYNYRRDNPHTAGQGVAPTHLPTPSQGHMIGSLDTFGPLLRPATAPLSTASQSQPSNNPSLSPKNTSSTKNPSRDISSASDNSRVPAFTAVRNALRQAALSAHGHGHGRAESDQGLGSPGLTSLSCAAASNFTIYEDKDEDEVMKDVDDGDKDKEEEQGVDDDAAAS